MPEYILLTEPEGGVVWLTLNRPEKWNALSIALRDEVSDALDALASDEEVKTVILTGAGDVFCAGFDLGDFQLNGPGRPATPVGVKRPVLNKPGATWCTGRCTIS
jgi:enoyl-CoA hydratase/carnithine racemase